jgi:hypothetical protein
MDECPGCLNRIPEGTIICDFCNYDLLSTKPQVKAVKPIEIAPLLTLSVSGTPNEQYKAAYEQDPFKSTFYATFKTTKETAQKEFTQLLLQEQKRRQPKKKNLDPLDDAFIEALKNRLLTKYKISEYDAQLAKQKKEREDLLWSLAKQVTPIVGGEPQLLDTSSTYSYSSQGYGAGKYARGALTPHHTTLTSLGFTAELRFVPYETNGSLRNSGDGTYELWANCPVWMADAIFKAMRMEDILRIMKSNHVNVRVYYPFLPYINGW